ncbi:hypothetical protein NDU88_009017 [Pleurodeles waltl]|uniref:Uncharacterized protein n=1 Tax=Pleurodeles waltl TaxID=8319 RepID=A0AAV7N8B9_PLEWA|nr:hypothetical protein NDU88_009017 [Pleurodeles waltl]
MSTPRSPDPEPRASWRWEGVRLLCGTLVSMSISRSTDPEPRASWRWAGVRLVCGTLVSKSIPGSQDPEQRRPRGAGQGCAWSVVHWFL